MLFDKLLVFEHNLLPERDLELISLVKLARLYFTVLYGIASYCMIINAKVLSGSVLSSKWFCLICT